MIALVHGRAPKPPRPQLETLWFEALLRGLGSQRSLLEQEPKTMVYYGDLSNRFLDEECDDLEDRRGLLESLERSDFSHYPGETAYGIDQPPDDILAYWNRSSEFSRELRKRVLDEIRPLLSVRSILVAHSLGAVLVSDALSSLSCSLADLTLVTLGSPLTLPHFLERTHLPQGLAAWHNVCAKGDLICGPTPCAATHHEIINPLLKEQQPDPHHALGYLRHPKVANLVSQWVIGH